MHSGFSVQCAARDTIEYIVVKHVTIPPCYTRHITGLEFNPRGMSLCKLISPAKSRHNFYNSFSLFNWSLYIGLFSNPNSVHFYVSVVQFCTSPPKSIHGCVSNVVISNHVFCSQAVIVDISVDVARGRAYYDRRFLALNRFLIPAKCSKRNKE